MMSSTDFQEADRPAMRQRQQDVRQYLRWRVNELYLGDLWVGEVMQWKAGPKQGKWRAWVLTESPGAHHGWFSTERDARHQVESVVCRATAGLVMATG
jgi:hypothetical protein